MVFKDLEKLQEAYELLEKKAFTKKTCTCKKCDACKKTHKKTEIKEAKSKPDYLDVDEDGNKKEPMKKALGDKANKKKIEERVSSFKTLFNAVMSESFGKEPYSNTYEHDKKVWMLRRLSNGEINKIVDEEQYDVTWKDEFVKKHNGQKQQPLKGESVLPFLSEIESISRPSFE